MNLLWTNQNAWYDFNNLITDPVITCVTENGTIHVLDRTAGIRKRFKEGYTTESYLLQMLFVFTPCGFVAYQTFSTWWESTNIVAIAEGSGINNEMRQLYLTLDKNIHPAGHPNNGCGARYCEWEMNQLKVKMDDEVKKAKAQEDYNLTTFF